MGSGCSTELCTTAVAYNVNLASRQGQGKSDKKKSKHQVSKSDNSYDISTPREIKARSISYRRMSSMNLKKFEMELNSICLFERQLDAYDKLDKWKSLYGIGPFADMSAKIVFHNNTRNFIHFESKYSNLTSNCQIFDQCKDFDKSIPPKRYWCLFCHHNNMDFQMNNLTQCGGYVCFNIGTERAYSHTDYYATCIWYSSWNSFSANDKKIKCEMTKSRPKTWKNIENIDGKQKDKSNGWGFRLEAKYLPDHNIFVFKLT